MVTQEKCAAYYIKSSSMAGRCIPAVNETISIIQQSGETIQVKSSFTLYTKIKIH